MNKYLLHDTYRVTRNLSLFDIAPREAVIEHVIVAGTRNNRQYTREEILGALNHLVQKKLLKLENGKYEVI